MPEESWFLDGYKRALRDVVLVGCICHEAGPDDRGKCPVCKAVEDLEKEMQKVRRNHAGRNGTVKTELSQEAGRSL